MCGNHGWQKREEREKKKKRKKETLHYSTRKLTSPDLRPSCCVQSHDRVIKKVTIVSLAWANVLDACQLLELFITTAVYSNDV